MTVQTFREMLARRPFQPVKLTLSSVELAVMGVAWLGLDLGGFGDSGEFLFRAASPMHAPQNPGGAGG